MYTVRAFIIVWWSTVCILEHSFHIFSFIVERSPTCTLRLWPAQVLLGGHVFVSYENIMEGVKCSRFQYIVVSFILCTYYFTESFLSVPENVPHSHVMSTADLTQTHVCVRSLVMLHKKCQSAHVPLSLALLLICWHAFILLPDLCISLLRYLAVVTSSLLLF